MNLIVGLGNPGPKYENTRHNMGFKVIDSLADKHRISVNRRRCRSLLGSGRIEGKKVILAKPQTYMNLSGEALSGLLNYYQLEIPDLIIVYDDVNLDLGRLRFRREGSAGGHNGIKSIIYHLDTEDFARLKLGIGTIDLLGDMMDYVLSEFDPEDEKVAEEMIERATEALRIYLTEGITEAMNRFNG